MPQRADHREVVLAPHFGAALRRGSRAPERPQPRSRSSRLPARSGSGSRRLFRVSCKALPVYDLHVGRKGAPAKTIPGEKLSPRSGSDATCGLTAAWADLRLAEPGRRPGVGGSALPDLRGRRGRPAPPDGREPQTVEGFEVAEEVVERGRRDVRLDDPVVGRLPVSSRLRTFGSWSLSQSWRKETRRSARTRSTRAITPGPVHHVERGLAGGGLLGARRAPLLALFLLVARGPETHSAFARGAALSALSFSNARSSESGGRGARRGGRRRRRSAAARLPFPPSASATAPRSAVSEKRPRALVRVAPRAARSQASRRQRRRARRGCR